MRVVACISLANTGHSYLLKSGLKIKAKEGWVGFFSSLFFVLRSFALRAVVAAATASPRWDVPHDRNRISWRSPGICSFVL
jgi:hypothetical protein